MDTIKSNFRLYKESYRKLFALGAPVFVTQVGIIVVSFADTMMVGAYGTDELAAAAFVNSLFLIPIVMQIGFAGGITPLVGALFSRGENRRIGQTMRGALQMNMSVSLCFSVIMGILYFFLDHFGQPEEIMPLIKDYYLIVLFSLLPLAAFNSIQQTCNGITDTAMPMWFILGQNVVNIVGNYLLIFGKMGLPEMGLAGAGFSTLFARVISTLGFAAVFFNAKRYRIYMHGWGEHSPLAGIRRKVWTTSYPLMIQSGVECALWSIGAVVCGWFGKIHLAAYQVVNIIGQLGFMTFISFGTAVSILVANHTGTADWKGVRRVTMAGLHLNLGLATIASAVFFFCGRWLLHAFTPDAEVIACGMTLILPLILYQYFDATQLTFCNAIRGTANVQPLLWISLISYILTGLPTMYLFAERLDGASLGVYYSFDVALLVAGILAVFVFYHTLRRLSGPCQKQVAQSSAS